MKVKMWNKVDVSNTSHQGKLHEGTTFNQIEEVFGKGSRLCRTDGKTYVEWQGKINGKVFTIYDYETGVKPEENTNWNIGAKDAGVAVLVKTHFIETCTSLTHKQVISEVLTPAKANMKKNLVEGMRNHIEQFEIMFEQYKNYVTYHEYENVKKIDETFAQMRFAFHQI